MRKTKIDWPGLDYLWNPVTGCRRECSYCVVRKRVWPRIKHCYGGHDFKNPTLQPDQFRRPASVKKPSTFFVGFYSDIEYWKREWLDDVLCTCNMNPRHTFMFLSKNYTAYDGFLWPQNTMQGLTVTKIELVEGVDVAMMFKYPHPFLSIEPLLGYVRGGLKNTPIERIFVGAMTGAEAVVPKPEWIQSVKDNVPADKLHWKTNIRKYL